MRVMQDDAHSTTILAEAARWQARDLAVLWHPCTQMREHPDTLPLVPIAHGEGAWLTGMDGRRYLDAVASWWTNIHGHAEPRIAEAIALILPFNTMNHGRHLAHRQASDERR